MSRFALPIVLLLWFICLIFSLSVFAQEVKTQEIKTTSKKPQPPPVEIMFDVKNISNSSEEVTLKLKVIPLEDMHVDISCLLPEGIKPVREKGVMVRPYRERCNYDRQGKIRYRYAVWLWTGPLKAKTVKEFTFRVVIPKEKKYELIVRIDALAKWGVKEEVLEISVK